MQQHLTGLLLCSGLTLMAPAAALAAPPPLPAAQTGLDVRSGADSDRFRGTGYHEVTADGSFAGPGFTGHGHAYAGVRASFAGPPRPVAAVDVSADWPCCGSTAAATAIGTASFVYYAQVINWAAPPPLPVPLAQLPINFIVSDYVSASVGGTPPPQSGSGSMTATVSVFRNLGHVGILLDRARASGNSDAETNSSFAAVSGKVNEVFGVTLAAEGSFTAGGNYGGSGSGHAVADPLFEFDQASFDQYLIGQGFAPFHLANYFAFEFSDGVVAGVPEPQTWALWFAGVAALVWRRGAAWHGTRR